MVKRLNLCMKNLSLITNLVFITFVFAGLSTGSGEVIERYFPNYFEYCIVCGKQI
jgi:hypothetical protein